jgi:hypothetical protein
MSKAGFAVALMFAFTGVRQLRPNVAQMVDPPQAASERWGYLLHSSIKNDRPARGLRTCSVLPPRSCARHGEQQLFHMICTVA